MRPFLLAGLAVALGPLALATALHAGSAAPLWLDVSAPARVEGPVPWLELRGQAGRADAVRHDVVVAIDVSGSTAAASGADLDGDGHLGRRLPSADDPLRRPNPRRLCSDPDDTVLQAQIEATRRLLERLSAPGTRVGLLAFASAARTLAPVGAPREALHAALETLAEEGMPSGGTHLGRALEAGVAMLEAGGGEAGTRRTLVLLSDGNPSEPAPGHRAEEVVLEAGVRLREADVQLRAFALGVDALSESDVVARLAGETGGTLRRLVSAAEVVDALPRLTLAGVGRIQVRNETLGEAGRAVRLFADGSFDAIVPLAPGVNTVRVTARGEDSETRTVERRVVFEPQRPADEASARAAERWLEQLRLRTLETDLAQQARQGRTPSAQDREVDVRGATETRRDPSSP